MGPKREQAAPNPHALAKVRGRSLAWQLAGSSAVGAATSLAGAQVALGIVAGLVFFVISVQLQALTRDAEAGLSEKFRLHRLADVEHVLAADPSLGAKLLDLARAQARYLATPNRPTVFEQELEHHLSTLVELYDECSVGAMRVDLRPAPFLRETDGVSSVSTTLQATSLVAPGPYWGSPIGAAYLAQQEALLDKGVCLRRVFVHPSKTLDELRDVVARHRSWAAKYGEARAQVRVALLDEVPEHLLADYAIVDGSIVIRLEMSRVTSQPVAVRWETSIPAVAKAESQFEQLWAHSHSVLDFPEFRDPV